MAEPTEPDPGRTGPYETEDQARADCRVVYVASRYSSRPDSMRELCEVRLVEECRRSGVTLGAYDRRILRWLSDWEPQTVQVVLGLIVRAYDAGHERGVRLGYRTSREWDQEYGNGS